MLLFIIYYANEKLNPMFSYPNMNKYTGLLWDLKYEPNITFKH